MANNNLTVRIANSQFNAGLKLVKGAHARYNPTAQTWTIPAAMVEYLRFVGSLELVAGEPPVTNRTGEPLRFAQPAQVVAGNDPYHGQMCPRCHTVCYGACRY